MPTPLPATSIGARSRWPPWPTCGVAPSTTPSSSWTRLKIRLPNRCRCSSHVWGSARRWGGPAVADILGDIRDIAFVTFGGEDVVRHKLVQDIVNAYKTYVEKKRGGEGRS